jgi:hypothetical protein
VSGAFSAGISSTFPPPGNPNSSQPLKGQDANAEMPARIGITSSPGGKYLTLLDRDFRCNWWLYILPGFISIWSQTLR